MTKLKHTHDAQRALSDLKDHLARHDKPIAFLFGAGTSCAVRIPDPVGRGRTRPLIPAIDGVTKSCQKDAQALGENYQKAWDSIEASCNEIDQVPNAENILSRLGMMLRAVGSADTLAGLNKNEIGKLENSIRKTIARIVTPDLSHITGDHPHRKLARWLVKTTRQNPVEIFTVNYDVLVEHALESERIPVF